MRRRLRTWCVAAVFVAIAALNPFGAIAAGAESSPLPSPAASAAPSPSATSGGSGGPSLLPQLDPTKAIYQALGGLFYGIDSTFTDEISNVWNPMVAGTDSLEGQQSIGVVIDNSKLKQMWSISFEIAAGSLLVLLFTIMAMLYMVGEFVGSRHELGRYLVNFLLFFVLMAGSYFLIEQLVNVDNSLIGAVNNNVAIELRSLKAFQLVHLQDPTTLDDVKALMHALIDALLMIFVVVELVILFVVYFMRIIALWILVVVSPFVLALGILPPARGLVVYWLRMLCAVVFMKFLNVLVFVTFVFMAAASDVAVMNVLLVFTMLLFMIVVPGSAMKALAEPSGAFRSAKRTGHLISVSRPVGIVKTMVRAGKAA